MYLINEVIIMDVEKRKYIRAGFDSEILYPTVILNQDKKTYCDNDNHLFAVNISEAGIRLCSNFFIPAESFISFYLRIEDNIPFKALVKVRWNKFDGGVFLCGGEFIALNLNEIYILRGYVTRHINK